ncbi:MAG: hypothetical protein WAM30_05715 [Candidatus Dormiibacterota bacterium]
MKTIPEGLSSGQRGVLTRLIEHLESDSRVEAAWLVGSLGHGLGDRFSDVDLLTAVSESALPAVVDEWPACSASLVDLAFARTVYSAPSGTTFTHVTSDYVRFDVTLTTTHRALENTQGGIALLASVPIDSDAAGPDEPPGVAADRVQKLSEEFLRVLGLLPVVIGRQEYLVAASGAALLRSMLVDLFRELAPPGYRGGAMRWERTLSLDQLEILRGLPSLDWTRDAVIDLHLACAREFLSAARRAYEALGLTWPQSFEDAVRLYVDRELGLTFE